MKNYPKFLMVSGIAVLLGLSLTLAFAPYAIYPLAIISPAGLLLLWLKASARKAFWFGFLFGLGLFGSGVYWVFIGMYYYGEVPLFFALLITGGLIATLALFPAFTGYLLNRIFPHTQAAKLVCAFPALWVLVEWIRSWVLTGFPWLLVGYSQTFTPLKGYAPILGVYGISLAALVCSGLLVGAWLAIQRKRYNIVYYNLFMFIAIFTVGSLLNLISWTEVQGEPVSVSLVQGNIPQEIKWSAEQIQTSLDRYETLTEPLWGKSQIIIWPETAIPTTLQDAAGYVDEMDKKAKNSHSHLILGIPIYAPQQHGYFNALVMLGDTHTVYLKRHLVPFGEYIPFSKLLTGLLNRLDIPASMLVPGNRNQPLLTIGNTKILAAICYEVSFPELINTNDQSVSMVLTVTNDAWFGRSSAQAQHFQMAAMRALELRRPVIIVGNNGISAIIKSDGTVEAAAPTHEAFVLTGTVQPVIGLTPWMSHGMDPVLLLTLALLFTALLAHRKAVRLASIPLKDEDLAST